MTVPQRNQTILGPAYSLIKKNPKIRLLGTA